MATVTAHRPLLHDPMPQKLSDVTLYVMQHRHLLQQGEDLREQGCALRASRLRAPTSRIIIRYSNRTSTPMIVSAKQEIPARRMRDKYWHLTRALNLLTSSADSHRAEPGICRPGRGSGISPGILSSSGPLMGYGRRRWLVVVSALR
uniref:hypothetical protein n=1 Tax=Micromonospora acroterricola TaxID=2202421 RepID=UPI0013749FD9|nr:hypothetical protein [Micromonospora acroterricola]